MTVGVTKRRHVQRFEELFGAGAFVGGSHGIGRRKMSDGGWIMSRRDKKCGLVEALAAGLVHADFMDVTVGDLG